MIISDKYKFIFIHVPKTGGTSISDALRKVNAIDSRSSMLPREVIDRYGIDRRFEKTWSHHLPAKQLRKIVGEDHWFSYFKFGFVRNPFDLLVSEYFYMKEKKIDGRESEQFMALYNMVKNTKDFKSYLFRRYRRCVSINLFSTIIDDNNEIAVDFVGRFENLENDFRKIIQIIGISVDLPRLNKSKHEHYSKYYSDEAKSLVSRICSYDLKRFSYKFEIAE